MNLAPQFSLRWNNYINHITDAFTLLRLDNDLVDVTLCCEGGKIKAHKMLLSACSAYFRQVFKETPCQHPVIIFKNVKFEDLSAIINFMYHGEVNIFQAQLESFLITAELLEVKGLTDNVDEEETRNKPKLDENLSLDLSCKQKNDEIVPLTSLETMEPMNLATIQAQRNESMPSSSVTHTVASPLSNNEDQVDLQTENLSIDDTSNGNQSIGEEMQVDNQNQGAEDLSDRSSSDVLAKFWCQLCPKGFKHPTSLTLHKDSHEGKTQCPVCHRSFSRSYDMRSHLQRIHRGQQLTIKEIRYKSTGDSIATKQFTHNA